MGIFDSIVNFFKGYKKAINNYDSKKALIYVKSNKKYLKEISPENRKEFEKIFLTLAQDEISNKHRYLYEDEINTLVQRVRIKLSKPKKSATQQILLDYIAQFDKEVDYLIENLKTHPKSVVSNNRNLLAINRSIQTYLKKNPNLPKNLVNTLLPLNMRQQELINNVDRCIKRNITSNQLMSFLVEYKRSYQKSKPQLLKLAS